MATELSGLSIYTIASDGHTVEFPLRFASGTLRDSYVRVAVDGEVDGSGNQIYRSFTKVPGDAGMIHINGTAPAAGTLITFQRVVPKDMLLHLYSNGSILNYPSLDESHLQLLMCVQELMDGFGFQNINTDLNLNNRNVLNVNRIEFADFSSSGAQSFREMLDEANAQLAMNQAEVAKAAAQAALATSYATQAQAHSASAISAATRAEAAALLVDPRMDAAEQEIVDFKAEVNTALNVLAMLIGKVFPLACSDSYVPNGCVPANGGEYTRAQFPTLYDTYLVGGRLLTCSYEQHAAQVGLTGNCGKFALDVSAQKFKVPLLKDGDSITQAASAAELGKSVKAGLPNITGTVGSIWNAETAAGACYRGNNEQSLSAGAGSVNYGPVYIDASRSSSVYGNSTTVTDEQVRLRHFVVVASAQNSASVFDWSAYMAALAGKANVDLGNVDLSKANIVLQRVVVEDTTMTSTTAVIPCDDTIPQITEGSQYLVGTITPKRANSKIDVEVTLCATCYNATSHLVAAVFKDSVPDAVAASLVTNGGVGFFTPLRIKKTIQFSDTNPHTISVRVGVPNNSYPISINGTSARILGGAITSSLILTEYAV